MNLQEVFAFLCRLSDDPEWTEFVIEFQKETLASLFAGHQRLGQALYNSMPGTKLPGLIAGTDYDPFYNDKNIPKFLVQLFELWTRIQAGEFE